MNTHQSNEPKDEHLRAAEIVRRDEIEPLPENFRGFWIQNPASIIHIVSEPDQY